jgi:hypothetical protein
MVTLLNPTAGTYTVFVHGFATNGPSANATVFDWVVPSASSGNMSVPGSTAVGIGSIVPVNLAFSGLAASSWYLGRVVYNDGTSNIGATFVNVNT